MIKMIKKCTRKPLKKLEMQKNSFSSAFVLMAVLFTVCLISSNLFAAKVFALGKITLPCAVLIFPISYILNDCFTEVWGYRKARLVIWTAFAMNLFVALTAQIAVLLPAAPFWTGGEHFDFVFKMKVAQDGKSFSIRAIVSSIAGECLDSLIFMPIAFWGTPWKDLAWMMLFQVTFKVLYEIIILPVTTRVVRKLKEVEEEDVYDRDIHYNPFKIFDY